MSDLARDIRPRSWSKEEFRAHQKQAYWTVSRVESDPMGEVEVRSDRLWGAQTERALKHFDIGLPRDKMDLAIIKSYALLKKASAKVNLTLGGLEWKTSDAIQKAADEVFNGKWDEHFPLSVWCSGSGTQINMNLNEVICNRSIEMLGGVVGSKKPVHPNDHVNMGQSSNDTFSTAMHMATAREVHNNLLPSITHLRDALDEKAKEFAKIIKIGRTHLQDAVPLTLGQEFSGYAHQLTNGITRIQSVLPRLYELPIGGTAVGTGLNTRASFGEKVVTELAGMTHLPFKVAPNKFEPLATCDTMIEIHGAINVVACSLMKIANDIMLMNSGPRCGIDELTLPKNEPGASVMPGKVNPTQCESLAMVCAQVMGSNVAVTIGGAHGVFELNTFKPLIVHNILSSITILSDACVMFTKHCVTGIKANPDKIEVHLKNSLMLVAALSPHIGYDSATLVARKAFDDDLTIKNAGLALDAFTADQYDKWVIPEEMLGPRE